MKMNNCGMQFIPNRIQLKKKLKKKKVKKITNKISKTTFYPATLRKEKSIFNFKSSKKKMRDKLAQFNRQPVNQGILKNNKPPL
jgi:hypothetical protein